MFLSIRIDYILFTKMSSLIDKTYYEQIKLILIKLVTALNLGNFDRIKSNRSSVNYMRFLLKKE